jgi:hypothetical protein
VDVGVKFDPLLTMIYQILLIYGIYNRVNMKKHGVKVVFSGHRHSSTRYQKEDGIYHFVHPALSTYPMRFTVYEMTPKHLKWEVRSVPAAPEVWELAKKNFLADKWWRGPEHADTPEGNQKYLEFYESPSTESFLRINSVMVIHKSSMESRTLGRTLTSTAFKGDSHEQIPDRSRCRKSS